MSTFGDWEPADSFAPDNVPDPEQVARRLHELREWLQTRGDVVPQTFYDLDDDELAVALCIGEALTRHLMATGRDGSALAVHDVRRYLSTGAHRIRVRQREPEWRDLGDDEQAIALAITDDIVRWLQLEGTAIS